LIGAGGTFTLKSQGGAVSVALAISNIPAHDHSFSATTNTTGNHNHKSGNHRHRSDNHSHSQSKHEHRIQVVPGQKDEQVRSSNAIGTNTDTSSVLTMSSNTKAVSAGGETTGGSSPYTDYQDPTSDTKGDHSHTISGTTGSSGSGDSFSILNPYRAVNIWRRTA